MNKKVLIVVSLIIAIIIGSFAYVLLTRDKVSAPRMNTEQKTQMKNPETGSEVAKVPGKYVDYTESERAHANGTILLFFFAPWCPQCRQIQGGIESQGVPENVTVLKVDYDTNQALRRQYGVTLQTTFVKVDAGGNKLASHVAYDEPTFDSVKRNLLP